MPANPMNPASADQPYRLGVVLLGAGRSERMGRPKLLLPWGETTVCGHLLAQWRELGAEQICAVCAEGDHGINAELDRLGWPLENRILNPVPELGMFSSIRCAARWQGWNTTLSQWAIVLGDQPHVRSATLGRLLSFAA